MKERDLDKTITGLLFQGDFLYGLLQLLIFAACVAGAVLMFKSDESIFLKIISAAILLLAGGSGFSIGSKHIRKAWKSWRSYVKGE